MYFKFFQLFKYLLATEITINIYNSYYTAKIIGILYIKMDKYKFYFFLFFFN